MWRIDFKVDGLSVDALVAARYPSRFCFNFAFDLGEVVEPPPRLVEKFSPFLLACDASRRMRNMYFIVCGSVLTVARKVDELQDQWPPRDDATPTRQEVPADDVL